MKSVTFVLLGLTLLVGCSKKGKSVGKPEVARPAKLRDVVRLTGTAQPVVQVDLKSEISGRIVKLGAIEGDTLKKGQLVVQLDAEQPKARRDAAALTVERAKLQLDVAKRDLDRANALLPTGTISKDKVQDLEIALRRAELDAKEAKLTLAQAETDLSRTRIVSPMNGRLISLPVEVGTVAASIAGMSGGTLLGTVADPSRMLVEVEVGELDYPRLKLGMPVDVFTESEPDKIRRGKVSFLSSSARLSADGRSVRVFPVEVRLDGKAADLVPGMTMNVEFVFLETKAAVTVPYEALQDALDGRGKVVKVRGPNGLKSLPVKSGMTDYRRTEILDGLKAGDTVWLPDVKSTSAAKTPGGPH